MKFITGFFMAWGNFITLPCPYKKWDNKLLNLMLMFLPSIGAVIGALWLIFIEVLAYFQLPDQVVAAAAVFFLFAICGFMHMDGFMDCNDAIMSRRPLEERQRILKDSNVGAFAVVTVVFLLLGWYASMSAQLENTDYFVYFMIPILSRTISGGCVMKCRPIGHSQYVADYEEPGKGKYYLGMLIQLAVLALIWAAIFGVGDIGARDGIVALIEVAVCFIACGYARHQLGGMSGDIAGYTICFGELAGIVAAAVIL
jgi:adenosylcobinamide-GDP ribazoletransferase